MVFFCSDRYRSICECGRRSLLCSISNWKLMKTNPVITNRCRSAVALDLLGMPLKCWKVWWCGRQQKHQTMKRIPRNWHPTAVAAMITAHVGRWEKSCPLTDMLHLVLIPLQSIYWFHSCINWGRNWICPFNWRSGSGRMRSLMKCRLIPNFY